MSVVDEYLQKLDGTQKKHLERIRHVVQQTVPDAEEVISYGMPAFKYNKKYLIGFAAFKDHMSIFPAAAPIAQLKAKLVKFKISKGTIQFTEDNPVSDSLIKELVKIRLKDILKD